MKIQITLQFVLCDSGIFQEQLFSGTQQIVPRFPEI